MARVMFSHYHLMDNCKKITRALVSVYDKTGLDDILKTLHDLGVQMVSTGGTRQFILGLGIPCEAVEDITSYPSILGGRVKTLHPKVFGGILNRRDNESDRSQTQQYQIPDIDLVIVDLYPFDETVRNGGTHQEIIEKIDIGGISLIRAAAKNYNDVVIVASKEQYPVLAAILHENGASTTEQQRRMLARDAFAVSSKYDSHIFDYFQGTFDKPAGLRLALDGARNLRYGENPHQKGTFVGNLDEMFTQLHGKEISYNNLGDIDAATALIAEFPASESATVAILKHNNACGAASRDTVCQAWKDALAGDPLSAFGGVIVSNTLIDAETAAEIDKIFFEVIVAPAYTDEALQILKHKKNRIILVQLMPNNATLTVRTALNGALVQHRDNATETTTDMRTVTVAAPTQQQLADMVFANKIVKHSKSNAIVVAKDAQLCGSGVGQTSRVDALRHAIAKAETFGLPLQGAVMASDAFFPFADCVEIAHEAGIAAAVQPGGSVRDDDSIQFCNDHGMPMTFTGIRHFKH